MTDKQRIMVEGMDMLLGKFNHQSDNKMFSVEEIIKASNEVYEEIMKNEVLSEINNPSKEDKELHNYTIKRKGR